VVALQVFGGLIVGMVVKYADNILKNFANALSVIFTVLGAIPLFGQWPSFWFIIGIAAVMFSVFMYSGTIPDVRCSLSLPHTMPCRREWNLEVRETEVGMKLGWGGVTKVEQPKKGEDAAKRTHFLMGSMSICCCSASCILPA
jgi:Nucleotide-sugar transporter